MESNSTTEEKIITEEKKIYLGKAVIGRRYKDANCEINYGLLLSIEEKYIGGKSAFECLFDRSGGHFEYKFEYGTLKSGLCMVIEY